MQLLLPSILYINLSLNKLAHKSNVKAFSLKKVIQYAIDAFFPLVFFLLLKI